MKRGTKHFVPLFVIYVFMSSPEISIQKKRIDMEEKTNYVKRTQLDMMIDLAEKEYQIPSKCPTSRS